MASNGPSNAGSAFIHSFIHSTNITQVSARAPKVWLKKHGGTGKAFTAGFLKDMTQDSPQPAIQKASQSFSGDIFPSPQFFTLAAATKIPTHPLSSHPPGLSVSIPCPHLY